jgi:hypothetical protein
MLSMMKYLNDSSETSKNSYHWLGALYRYEYEYLMSSNTTHNTRCFYKTPPHTFHTPRSNSLTVITTTPKYFMLSSHFNLNF